MEGGTPLHVLKKYKAVLLSGLLVVVFCVAAYCAVGRADSADSQYTYAEHIYQDDTENEINIEIDEADWQDMLENPLEEEYHKANITINGETVGNVAIRTKGNNSLTSVASSDSDRYSFKIDFDYYDDNSNYYGLKKLCLNNNYSDNSSMREYISYKIMGELGLDVPQCGYSNITVNGEEWGLYLAVEAIDETFLETHFDDATGDLYKPAGQDGTGADLVYDGDDISSYTGLNLITNEDTSDGKEIIALMKALEDGENLEDLLDVESALKYIAANVALANFDSYLGNTTHNYYLYEEDGYFTVIPWDMNLAFGGFGGGDVLRTADHLGGRGGFTQPGTLFLPVVARLARLLLVGLVRFGSRSGLFPGGFLHRFLHGNFRSGRRCGLRRRGRRGGLCLGCAGHADDAGRGRLAFTRGPAFRAGRLFAFSRGVLGGLAAAADNDAGLHFAAAALFGCGGVFQMVLHALDVLRSNAAGSAFRRNIQLTQRLQKILGRYAKLRRKVFHLGLVFSHALISLTLPPACAEPPEFFPAGRFRAYIPAASGLGLALIDQKFPPLRGQNVAHELLFGHAPSAYGAHPGGHMPPVHAIRLPRPPFRRPCPHRHRPCRPIRPLRERGS